MHVLVAGGVGITPMMSMIRTLADRGDKRPIILLYGGKDWESLIFREELDEINSRLNLTVVYVVANPPDGWSGEKGYINADTLKRYLPPPFAQHEYFICGSDVMMNSIEKAFGDLHVSLSKYHSERYSFVYEDPPMRRLFADRLVIATAVIVIAMSAVFALMRVVG